MKKRVLSGVLWFVTGWYAGAMIAYFVGISPLLAPILGATAAFLVAGDPRGVIWNRTSKAPVLTPEPTPA